MLIFWEFSQLRDVFRVTLAPGVSHFFLSTQLREQGSVSAWDLHINYAVKSSSTLQSAINVKAVKSNRKSIVLTTQISIIIIPSSNNKCAKLINDVKEDGKRTHSFIANKVLWSFMLLFKLPVEHELGKPFEMLD